MSSELESEFITRTKKVNGFTGVGTLFAIGDDQICFVCADKSVLAQLLRELMPNADCSAVRFQNLTIIQANEKSS